MSDIVHQQLAGCIRTGTNTLLKGCPYCPYSPSSHYQR